MSSKEKSETRGENALRGRLIRFFPFRRRRRLNETSSAVRGLATDVGGVAERDVLVAAIDNGRSQREGEGRGRKDNAQAGLRVLPRVVTEADDEVAEGSVAKGVADHGPNCLVSVKARRRKRRSAAKSGQKREAEDIHVDDLELLWRQLIRYRRPNPHRPLLEQTPQPLLDRGQVCPPNLLQVRLLRSLRHLRLYEEDRLESTGSVARLVDEADETGVGRCADGGGVRFHTEEDRL